VRRRRGFRVVAFSDEVVRTVADGVLRGALQHQRVAWGTERKVIEGKCPKVNTH
jgi:hypothetical protein